MSKTPYRVVPLDGGHERTTFVSDSEALNCYFRQQVMQDARGRVTAGFVALDSEHRVAGYYTLAAASVLLAELPDATAKKLPRCPSVPAMRMGRMAVDPAFKGQGLGGALLADALGRAAQLEVAAFAFVVDAKDETAAAFYVHHGFIALPDRPLTLFLPPATVRGSI